MEVQLKRNKTKKVQPNCTPDVWYILVATGIDGDGKPCIIVKKPGEDGEVKKAGEEEDPPRVVHPNSITQSRIREHVDHDHNALLLGRYISLATALEAREVRRTPRPRKAKENGAQETKRAPKKKKQKSRADEINDEENSESSPSPPKRKNRRPSSKSRSQKQDGAGNSHGNPGTAATLSVHTAPIAPQGVALNSVSAPVVSQVNSVAPQGVALNSVSAPVVSQVNSVTTAPPPAAYSSLVHHYHRPFTAANQVQPLNVQALPAGFPSAGYANPMFSFFQQPPVNAMSMSVPTVYPANMQGYPANAPGYPPVAMASHAGNAFRKCECSWLHDFSRASRATNDSRSCSNASNRARGFSACAGSAS